MKKRKKSVEKNFNYVGFDLKDRYKKSFDYLKDSKNFIYVIMGLFFVFSFAGFFFSDLINVFFNSAFGIDLNAKISEFIQNLISETKGMSQVELILFIFKNNLWSSFFGMIAGAIFGIFSVAVILVNGYLLGVVGFMSVKAEGVFILWRLFPHGIFELPAIFISLGMGLKLGSFIFQKRKGEAFITYLVNSLWVFLLIVFPLLIIAAIIEGSLIALGV